MQFLINLKLAKQQQKLPRTPGVYLFSNKEGKIIYVGKASSLKTRTASYFKNNPDPKTRQLVKNAHSLRYIETQSALEALFLEADLIKQHQPQYNIRQKDDKSSAYLVLTDEKFPRLEITRPTALHKFKIKKSWGPFISKRELEQALRILRRIFPYHSDKSFKKPCFYYQLGLCPGPCAGQVSAREYSQILKNLTLIFDGKKKHIIKKLEREMLLLSLEQKYEKASAIRDTLWALKNHKDISLSRKNFTDWKVIKNIPKRLEAYDISNIAGKYAVGSMVVFSYGRADKTEYRKFKIKMKNEPNDIGMIKEIISRRFYNDWERPSVIFIDGGLGQLRAAQEVVRELGLRIPIISAAKGPDRKGFKIFKTHSKIEIDRELLKEASQEAHRFAINYHRKLYKKGFLPKR